MNRTQKSAENSVFDWIFGIFCFLPEMNTCDDTEGSLYEVCRNFFLLVAMVTFTYDVGMNILDICSHMRVVQILLQPK